MFAKLPATAATVISWIEKGICFGSLAFLALLPFAELVLRQFDIPIPHSRGLMIHAFLVLVFFAAMLTSKSKGHIAIGIVQYIKNDKLTRVLGFAGTLLVVFLLTLLAWNTLPYIRFGFLGRTVWFIPVWFFALAMPLGYFVMALRFSFGIKSWRGRAMAFAAVLLGTLAALPAIAKLIWEFEPPEPFYSLVDRMYYVMIHFPYIRVPAILLLIFAALSGMPIFAAIGGIATIMLKSMGQEPEAFHIPVFDTLTGPGLVAIPLFTLTGFFLSESRAGERLVKAFRIFFSWLPGSVIIVAVLISAFFSSFTGASGVTILALGGILYTIFKKNGYSERTSIGLLTAAGGTGVMFPPSLAIILVASTSSMILHFMRSAVDTGFAYYYDMFFNGGFGFHDYSYHNFYDGLYGWQDTFANGSAGVHVEYTVIHYFVGAIIPGLILLLAMIATGMFLSFRSRTRTESPDAGAPGAVNAAPRSWFNRLAAQGLIHKESVGSAVAPRSLREWFLGAPLLVLLLAGIFRFFGVTVAVVLILATIIIVDMYLSYKSKPRPDSGDDSKRETFSLGDAFHSLRESFLEIMLPVVLVMGFFTGRLTLMEVSAVSVIYVVIVEVFIKKDIAIRDIPRVFSKAVPVVGGVLVIIAMASGLAYAFVWSGLPATFTEWMLDTVQSRLVFLLLLNVALLLVGTVVDMFSAIMVLLPLVVPLGIAYDINALHLGIIFILNLEAGFLTPPVGINLFLASSRFEKPVMQICRSVLPFFLVRIAVLLLVAYIPQLSTWLPGFLN